MKKEIQKNYDEMVRENSVLVKQSSDLPSLKEINRSSLLIEIDSSS